MGALSCYIVLMEFYKTDKIIETLEHTHTRGTFNVGP
jgi:hypothetical protein